MANSEDYFSTIEDIAALLPDRSRIQKDTDFGHGAGIQPTAANEDAAAADRSDGHDAVCDDVDVVAAVIATGAMGFDAVEQSDGTPAVATINSHQDETVVLTDIDASVATPVGSGNFPSWPPVANEFRINLDQVEIGKDHTRRDYDFDSGIGKSLLHAAMDPDRLAPIMVMLIGNVWYVVDGWARVLALRHQHRDNAPQIAIRAVPWAGTEEDLVLHRFGQSFMTLGSKRIELARLLGQMNRVWSVPQQVLAARIGWTESKVTRHLAADEGERCEPRFATLLSRPTDPSIDYMYKVGKALRDAGTEDAAHPKRSTAKGAVAALTNKLEGLLAKKPRFEPRDALIALGLAKAAAEPQLPFESDPGSTKREASIETVIMSDVVGHDDVVVGALELHADNQPRLLLPADPAGMGAIEKEAARAAFHAAIDKYFS